MKQGIRVLPSGLKMSRSARWSLALEPAQMRMTFLQVIEPTEAAAGAADKAAASAASGLREAAAGDAACSAPSRGQYAEERSTSAASKPHKGTSDAVLDSREAGQVANNWKPSLNLDFAKHPHDGGLGAYAEGRGMVA